MASKPEKKKAAPKASIETEAKAAVSKAENVAKAAAFTAKPKSASVVPFNPLSGIATPDFSTFNQSIRINKIATFMGQVASAMTSNKFLFTFLLGLAVAPSFAQTTTWSEHVAPILYAHCTSCHNAAGIAPFSLMSYADAYDNANDIADAVADRTMPPWPPDPTYSGFAHQRVLSQSDRDRIADWLTDGAPEGDTALAPDPPVYSGLAELRIPIW